MYNFGRKATYMFNLLIKQDFDNHLSIPQS